MPSIFTLIGSAWSLYRKHTVLLMITAWLLALPMFASSVLTRMLESGPLPDTVPVTLLALLFLGFMGIVITWGTACVLLVGKRMLQNKAGRSRSSFSVVRLEASTVVLPMILTGILRSCITFLWSLLFVIPGIIYSIRTAFYSVIIVTEGLTCREALSKSSRSVKGHTWRVFFSLIGLGLLLFVPANIISSVLERIVVALDPGFLPVADLLRSILMSGALVLFLLANVALYGALKKKVAKSQQ